MDLGNVPESKSASGLGEQVWHLTNENVQLQDRNERLYEKLGELQERMTKLAGSKTDLSSKLVFSEEEKLKISKDLIDLQIETNKMREEYEAENFELKNMILTVENRVLELELHDEKVTEERDALRGRLHVVETNRKELADEYIILKTNYLALGKEHEQEVSKNEELSIELLNLAGARSSQPQGIYIKSKAPAKENSDELERARAVVHRLSARRMKPEDVVASEHERRKLERSLLGNQEHIKAEIEKMKQMYDSRQQKLEERVVAMAKELQEAKRAIRNTQHKLAEQSAVLLTSQSQLQEVDTENSRLQLQLKELNEEYRARLTQYITDLAVMPPELVHMKRFVDSMFKDIRTSHKSREEQLAGAARSYKKRMQNLVKRHESLLIAYRMQREQIQSLGSGEMDPGPPEHHFAITDAELQTSASQELNQMREDKARLEAQLNDLQEKYMFWVCMWHCNPHVLLSPSKLDEEIWAELRKQLREFTHSTQEDLERERSQLLTRAFVAEEQLAELQEYVDKHLARYKQEILRLRKLLGSEAPRAFSAGAPNVPLMPKSKRTISHEL
uniref:Coiled-coil domain containing 78 n=1 Tax=Sphenodon punctatus TaxID=8508 RepID=A0A8D0H1Z0_SPHPU